MTNPNRRRRDMATDLVSQPSFNEPAPKPAWNSKQQGRCGGVFSKSNSFPRNQKIPHHVFDRLVFRLTVVLHSCARDPIASSAGAHDPLHDFNLFAPS